MTGAIILLEWSLQAYIYNHIVGPFTAVGIDLQTTALIAEAIAAGIVAEQATTAVLPDYAGAGVVFDAATGGGVLSNEASGIVLDPDQRLSLT